MNSIFRTQRDQTQDRGCPASAVCHRSASCRQSERGTGGLGGRGNCGGIHPLKVRHQQSICTRANRGWSNRRINRESGVEREAVFRLQRKSPSIATPFRTRARKTPCQNPRRRLGTPNRAGTIARDAS